MEPSAPKLAPTAASAIDALTAPGAIKFVKAANLTPAARTKIRNIVIHAMDGGEDAKRAENCAAWMAGQLAPKFPPPDASAHYAVDSDSVVQMVREQDIAWHAPGLNKDSLGIEHAGKGDQTAAEWLDAFGVSMLQISASLTARLCTKYQIPVVFVDADGLKAGHAGITMHSTVNQAFKRSTHTDPGPFFPLDYYLGLVKSAQLRLAAGA